MNRKALRYAIHRLRVGPGISIWPLVGMLAVIAAGSQATPLMAAPVAYVDSRATGANDGSSWENAFTDLQSALYAAEASGGAINEIRVAQGHYGAAFRLVKGVTVRGGYAGLGALVPDARDSPLYETVLSRGQPGSTYPIVNAVQTDITAVLDGFAISGGNAERGSGAFIENGGVTIQTCVFRENISRDVGTIWHKNSTSIIRNCSFVHNQAGSHYGGGGTGIHNVFGSRLSLVGCRFENNQGGHAGAGVFNGNDSAATIVNCRFSGNTALTGAAVYNDGFLTVVNGLFVGNSAYDSGGAITSRGQLLLTNVTMVANAASRLGGGLYIAGGNADIRNSILWGNRDSSGTTERGQITVEIGEVFVGHTCLQRWSGSLGGEGNFGADPQFADVTAGDWHLRQGSPCIDAGSNAALPADLADADGDGVAEELLPVDIAGSPRRVDQLHARDLGVGYFPIVDIGAFESITDCNGNGRSDAQDVALGVSNDCDADTVLDECEADCDANGVSDDCDLGLGRSMDCNINGLMDICELKDLLATDCDGNGYLDTCDLVDGRARDCDWDNMLDVCEIASGKSDDCNANAIPDACDIRDGTSSDCGNSGIPNECELSDGRLTDANENGVADLCEINVLFIDSSGPTDGDGSSWGRPYHFLETGLAHARMSNGIVHEIRLAGGTYRPARRTIPNHPRSVTFELVNGVALRGGYAGASAVDPDVRDFVLYETVLSGDLNGDDAPGFVNYGENAYHVVTGYQLNDATVLEGVTVSGGSADVVGHRFGGAMLLRECSPQIRSCVFRDNWAGLTQAASPGTGEVAHSDGGGAVSMNLNTDETPAVLQACLFERNFTNGTGGGLYLGGARLHLTECQFRGNAASLGGGLGAENYGYWDELVLDACYFGQNRATYLGGALWAQSYAARTSECLRSTFIENTASAGGAVYLYGGLWRVMDSWFEANSTSGSGGGIAVVYSDTIHIENSVFRWNRAVSEGGGVYVQYATPIIQGSDFLANSAERGGALGTSADSVMAHVERCSFRGNYAEDGGAIWIPPGGALLNVISSELMGNRASYFGGAITALGGGFYASNANVIGNHAGALGGGIITVNDTFIWNSILWQNTVGTEYPPRSDESAQLEGSGSMSLNYSCVQGWSGLLDGIENIDVDPMLIGQPGAGDYWWPVDADLRLRPSSPLINAGSPFALPDDQTADLDGHARLLCGRVDIGAYESGIGDYYCDGAVALNDYAAGQWCRSGPAVKYAQWNNCEPFDFDADLDVDLKDFAGFQRVFGASP